MAVDFHTVSVIPGAAPALSDRFFMGIIPVPYGAGAMGSTVSVPVTGLSLPPTSMFFVSVGVDATAFVSAVTANGFTLNVQPRLATATLAAGSVGVLIVS